MKKKLRNELEDNTDYSQGSATGSSNDHGVDKNGTPQAVKTNNTLNLNKIQHINILQPNSIYDKTPNDFCNNNFDLECTPYIHRKNWCWNIQ